MAERREEEEDVQSKEAKNKRQKTREDMSMRLAYPDVAPGEWCRG